MTQAPIEPAMTLRDLTGPGHRVLLRASERRGRWLQPDRQFREASSGGVVSTCGAIPYLMSAASASPVVRRLFARAGMTFPPEVETYDDLDDYPRRLAEFVAPGRVVLQHVHDPREIAPELCWIPPALLSWLNNKASLAELVPAAAVAKRRVTTSAELSDAPPALPCVVKAATDDSTGGGLDVVLCRTAADLADAVRLFSGIEQVVIEKFLEIDRSFCLNFGVFAGGRVVYLGAAEQVCTPSGRFAGNWIEGVRLPESVVAPARHAVERGAALGYYGFAGVDVALTEDGPFVIDLNFRYNASTSPLLYFNALRERLGQVVVRSKRWAVSGDGWEDAVARAIDSGRLLPIYIHDPQSSPFRDRPAFVSAAIAGGDRADVERFLADSGI